MARRDNTARPAVGIWLFAMAVTLLAVGVVVLLGSWWARTDKLTGSSAVAAYIIVAGPTILVLAVVAGFMARLLERVFLNDLSGIVQWVNAVEDGSWEALPVPNAGLWGQLAYALNQMAARLASSEKERDLFLAGVAHELKTPLSVLKGNVEGLADGLLEPTPERWTALSREVNRLTRLVNDLLLIETMRHPSRILKVTPYDPEDQITALMLRFEPLAKIREVAITGETTVHRVTADPDRMEQVLVNLVDNALRNAPVGGRIHLSVKSEGDVVRWCVADDGPGISPAARRVVIQPFFRDPRSKGTGLGLAVAAALVQAHRGTLSIEQSEWGGALVCVRVPEQSQDG